jgi:archaeosortase A (PGF-CTERM-specific)
MRFLSGGISIAMLIYFMVQRIPILAGGLIKAVAVQTNWILRLMGYEFTTSAINYGGNPLLYRANLNDIFVTILGSNINIILACTGLQVIAAAAGLLYSTDSKTNLKLKSLILVIPTVYIANIFRNVLVIYLTVENITSFSIAHNEIAKTGSVIVLVILLIGVFEIMPKFHDNIINVIKLPKRKPIHQKQQR